MPYNIGTDRLENMAPDKVRRSLSEGDETRLEADMRDLYSRLLPTEVVEINRKKLVQKLEQLFNQEWPGHDIQVHLFGSSGNLLCSDDSDGQLSCRYHPWNCGANTTCGSGHLHHD